MIIDLHTHSAHSDGTESPSALVESASAAGVRVIALTDHDVSSGWAEADTAGRVHGVSVLPGIEVSCSADGITVHLLAYLPDPEHPALAGELERSRRSRETRLQRMTELIAADGYPIDFAQVRSQAAGGATLGRPHIADALVEIGAVPDRQAAFTTMLAKRGPYYVSHYAPDPVTAVHTVIAAGGVPVMAHPFASARGDVVDDAVIDAMAEAGLFGLEADHRDHDQAQRQYAVDLAERLDLAVTGSSDYHGSGKPNRLGENTTTPEVLAQIIARGTGSTVLGAALP